MTQLFVSICRNYELGVDLLFGPLCVVRLTSGHLQLATPTAEVCGPDVMHGLAEACLKSALFDPRRAGRLLFQCHRNGFEIEGWSAVQVKEWADVLLPVKTVRDSHEHWLDPEGTISPEPRIHPQQGSLVDDVSMVATGPEAILMGSVNMYEIYAKVRPFSQPIG